MSDGKTHGRKSFSSRVLLVDDSTDTLELLGQVLRDAGHEVRIAADGDAALAVLEIFRPHVAILDIGLPGMNGYELARQIRARMPCQLIALSGFSANNAQSEPDAKSFDEYLVKPVDITSLLYSVGAASLAATAAAADRGS